MLNTNNAGLLIIGGDHIIPMSQVSSIDTTHKQVTLTSGDTIYARTLHTKQLLPDTSGQYCVYLLNGERFDVIEIIGWNVETSLLGDAHISLPIVAGDILEQEPYLVYDREAETAIVPELTNPQSLENTMTYLKGSMRSAFNG